VLPDVEVTLVRTGEPVAALHRVAVTATFVPRTARTSSSGSYRFTGLPPGSYRVTASAHSDGFGYTSDTDGLRDWQVDVAVPAHGTGIASFAGLGKGRLTGVVLDRVRGSGIASAAVQCSWAGFDDIFGTADDVVLTDTANGAGAYDWRGVPYGLFRCTGSDPLTGETSAAARLSVMSAAAVHATLPVGAVRASRFSVRRAIPTIAALPRTGLSLAPAVAGGLALILLGQLAWAAGRRRRFTSAD
jgi:hypothetical protein